jgi:peptidoglycan/xylan/chitin deacetylase (PgdA/CDA1 family)
MFFLNLKAQQVFDNQGALIRSDQNQKNIYLIFSGHDFYEGFDHVLSVLERKKIQGSFFLTGDFVRMQTGLTKRIAAEGHFIGAHSDKHLLYCDWEKRDSLLYSQEDIKKDILDNLIELKRLDIEPEYFLPPFEWYNQQVVEIARELDQQTINFSPGTRSNADYTTPSMNNYLSSDEILKSIYKYESENGMNGFHLLIHPGTSSERDDKLYLRLESLLNSLEQRGYHFERF